ncbi:outer membrane protein [Parvularcula sp. IMCC14364]|uniref:outer membrane protein n=1 Tax=Parvularcula sp. IMCC14364 TaxID=3067902 RepID=UPI0027424576|nr:outer membrane beta-barrel protein [Parvularcula sp. IMCC14364]
MKRSKFFLGLSMALLAGWGTAKAQPQQYTFNPRAVSAASAADSRLGARDAKSSVLSGPRAELRLGYDSFETEDPVAGSIEEDGALWGFSLGYDHQMSKLIIGAFTSIEWSSTSFAGGVDTGRDVEVGGKLGYLLRDDLTVYTLVALVNSQLTGNGAEAFDDGLRVGFGGEFALPRNLFAKVEYRYTDYDDDTERHQVVTAVGKKF